MEKVLQAFREQLGGEAEFIIRSPGRVNLIGEHTDYNDGFVMPFAIDRATWIALRRRKQEGARLFSIDFGEWAEADSNSPLQKKADHSWKQFLAGVTGEMLMLPHALGGWEGVSLSTLPIGAGLSSSASFELALARAFAVASELPWDATAMALLAHRVEVDWVGVNCGTMDQLAVALGRRDHALLLDCRSLEVRANPLPAGTAVVIMDTTKARTLAGSAYNERRAQCEEAARLLGAKSLRDVSMDALARAEAELDPLLARRARHVVSENERTQQAGEAMKADDAARLGALMNASHESLRLDYEVSSAELDVMVDAARRQSGCYGARMTGAGFGGCAVALVEQREVDSFVAEVEKDYQQATGLTPRLYVSRAEDGVACELVR